QSATAMNHEVRRLFHELLELSPSERERVFRERGIGADVRAEVEGLLRFDVTTGGLTEVVANAAGHMLDGVDGSEMHRCGPYQLIQRIGSGGMGVVYLAERADGEIQ